MRFGECPQLLLQSVVEFTASICGEETRRLGPGRSGTRSGCAIECPRCRRATRSGDHDCSRRLPRPGLFGARFLGERRQRWTWIHEDSCVLKRRACSGGDAGTRRGRDTLGLMDVGRFIAIDAPLIGRP